ncbi:hypothetical protein [Nocardia sp. NPDC046763]|uniref:hypothetical protein n=1 Tax=Nocardia sp. NPDC046763 TaxID=3155256 RepID=UPI0033F53770
MLKGVFGSRRVKADQTCQTPGGTVTMSFWSMASDGTHLISIMNSTDPQNGSYFLGSGSSTRQR